MSTLGPSAGYVQLLKDGGEMGERIRSFNWSATPLGVPEQWPQSLLITLNILLHSRFPMFLWWGPDLIQFYNDAYRPSLGDEGKHPLALGQRAVDCWPERWPEISSRISHILSGGEAIWQEDLLIPIPRNGQLEESYWTFSYSGVGDDTGNTAGVLVVCNETTRQRTAVKNIQHVYEQARLSKEAAQLGTFDMDLEKDTLEWDERCRTLFGISHSGAVSYKKDFLLGLHPDDRERVKELIGKVFIKSESDGNYDVEYRTIGAEDQKLRWVRAKGKAYFDQQDKPVRFIGSVLDITEQKSDELRKNDFISMVSHELKTPLTSLKAYIQILLEYQGENRDVFVEEALQKADNQVRKMSTLINSFLNISRLESGKIHLLTQSFDLNGLIKEIINEMQLILSGHKIAFKADTPVMIQADKDKIGSVLSNLLSNAGKYSPQGSTISVKCYRADSQIHLSVSDKGMGIHQQDLQKLFDRYYRVENNNTRLISGFGIGLYLSAEIIRRHGGHIWAESEPGKGSVFHFTLPVD